MVQLSNIVSLKETVAPKELAASTSCARVTIQANLAPGYTLGQAIAVGADQAAAEVLPPRRADRSHRPEPRVPRRQSATSLFIFVLALAFIYLVLSAQFESFRDPADDHADGAAVDDRRAAARSSSPAARSTSIRRSAS